MQNGSVNTDRGLLQVVSGSGEFNDAVVRAFLTSNKLDQAGVDYQIIAITGPQSSGKSTLLNYVFGTKFEEMDAFKGRGQTTKGIWLARSTKISSPPTLVMDLEGSDGRERGEDDTSFERQSSLFALAIADVLVINIWAKDIGRETGSGKPLLKTVFQVNLKLFAPAPNRRRTVLLFVFRDRTRTPLPKLIEVWTGDLERMWDSIAKPPQFADSNLTDFFEVQYAALPNFEEKEEDFRAESFILKRRFEPEEEGTLVRASPDKLPGHTLGLSMQKVWEVIREQKDLNLPAHKVMVANIRCAEIAAEQLKALQQDQAWLSLSQQASSGSVPGFGAQAGALISSSLTGYDEEARYFDSGVKQEKQAELVQKLHEAVHPAFSAQLGHLRKATLLTFQQSLKTTLGAHPRTFAAAASRCRGDAMQFYLKGLQEVMIEGTGWDTQQPLADCQADLDAWVVDLKKAEMTKVTNDGRKSLGEVLSGPALALLEAAPQDLWPRLASLCSRAISSVNQASHEALAGYALSSEEQKGMRQQLEQACQERLDSHLQEAAHTLLGRMKDRFTQHFSRDEHNLPRVWGTRTKIPVITSKSRLAAAELLALLAVDRIHAPKDAVVGVERAVVGLAATSGQLRTVSSDLGQAPASSSSSSVGGHPQDALDMLTASEWPGISPAHVLQTPSQCRTLWRHFVSDSELSVQQAMATQQATRAASNRMPPVWALAAIGVLGFNEAVAVLYNPIWLMVLLMGGLFAWSLYKEMDVDAELQHGPLPAALSLSGKFLPATRRVISRTATSIMHLGQPDTQRQMLHTVQHQAFTVEWVATIQKKLLESTRSGLGGLSSVLSAAKICSILDALGKILKSEPTVQDVEPHTADTTVTVVGDTHGQFHDVCEMLRIAGAPSSSRLYVFNGDFVDRGAWGLETLMLLACWKLALPKQVTLLRGNHETTTCTYMYGFRGEIFGKYSKLDAKEIYRRSKGVFAMLPLAAVIHQRTLVMHGGLFRKPQPQPKGVNKRKRKASQGSQRPAELGNLSDLRGASKGGLDPNGLGAAGIAADVLWSDPVADPGLELNEQRGVGTVFGPDITEQFLAQNNLKLILRSHEGPDARYKRDDMPSVDQGYALDHQCSSGKLMTVFSAPDYPQFQADDDDRYNNLAAVALLSSPCYDEPHFLQYSAVLPRPAATAFYEYQDVPGSDEEMPDLDGAMRQGDDEFPPDAASSDGALLGKSDDLHGDPAA
ncbi:hypothetical protein WJX84_006772 [Apatococcus fuscideae]|uniref:Protein ROOT HAIR DEFECTIVE 3 homolog n=1 Tax=Apatococcus fuscideae TaxID=2026836 RepID=A0AAW1TBK7_9CHLO